jgi:hypothetical protein
MKNKKDSRYDSFMTELRKFKEACDDYKSKTGGTYSKCDEFDYDQLLAIQ